MVEGKQTEGSAALRRYAAEFLGTLILVFLATRAAHPLGAGMALAVALWITGHASGGHYNPAVTITMRLNGRMRTADVVPYLLAQVAGGLTGAALVAYLLGRDAVAMPPTLGDPIRDLVAEFAFATLLAGAIAVSTLVYPKLAPMMIPLILAGTGWMAGDVSGAVMNPAASIGILAVGPAGLGTLWLYVLGPALGGVAAAFLQRFFVSDAIPPEDWALSAR